MKLDQKRVRERVMESNESVQAVKQFISVRPTADIEFGKRSSETCTLISCNSHDLLKIQYLAQRGKDGIFLST